MKIKHAVIIGLLLATAFGVQAQTNNTAGPVTPNLFGGTLGNIAAAFQSGTWAAGGGYERGATGNKNIASAEIAYNFTNGIGLLLGNDVLFGKGKPQQESVKGGVTLQGVIHPFAFIGSTALTNMPATVAVSDVIATPNNGNAIGNIVVTSIAFHIVNVNIFGLNNFDLKIAPNYENRSGQGNWSGNYFGIQAFLCRDF